MTVLLYFNKVLVFNSFWGQSKHDCNTERIIHCEQKAWGTIQEGYDLAVLVIDHIGPKAFEGLETKIFQYYENNTQQQHTLLWGPPLSGPLHREPPKDTTDSIASEHSTTLNQNIYTT